MIPKNITREDVVHALREIQENGVPPRYGYRTNYVLFENDKFPPKYVIMVANKYANGKELGSSEFITGEARRYLRSLGFNVIQTEEPSEEIEEQKTLVSKEKAVFAKKQHEKEKGRLKRISKVKFLINKEKAIKFGKALRDGYAQYFEFYNENIRRQMPEHKYFPPQYNDPRSAYAHFFGCMVDQAGVSGKVTWKNMRKLEESDPNIFDPAYLLSKYPEKYNCKERSKKSSSCPAKEFLDDYHLPFYLGHAHTMFRSAHFFNKLKKEGKIDTILDLPQLERYKNAQSLYYDLRDWIYKTSQMPKTLSLAFRIMTENNEGIPEGEDRFWNYDAHELEDIPMPVDFWIAYFVFKLGLMELDEEVAIISPSNSEVKQSINELFQKIAKISGMPPIFMDPIIWKIAGDKCINGFCRSCLFKDTLGYECPQSTKIYSVSQTKKKRKAYYLLWIQKEDWKLNDLPKGYKLEPKGRRN
ncbi:MAG: N-glycosylase/DNA lyase [Euryarchaeota archaeon]|nr:N-glycosylase/DNA lyase [Euryarchaeota archaeon]